MTLVVVRVQTLGMVNNAKSVPQNHVMVMVYGTTSNALACVMRHGSPIRNAKHVAIWNVVYMEHSLKYYINPSSNFNVFSFNCDEIMLYLEIREANYFQSN